MTAIRFNTSARPLYEGLGLRKLKTRIATLFALHANTEHSGHMHEMTNTLALSVELVSSMSHIISVLGPNGKLAAQA